jgi:hypothetical protein
VLDAYAGHFRSAGPAAEQDGNHGVVPRAAQGSTVERAEQSLTLIGREPVPEPYAVLFNTLYPSYTGGEIRTEKTGIGSFVG